jgi:DNA-binding transcriptional regulator LsrR (DeoR family)
MAAPDHAKLARAARELEGIRAKLERVESERNALLAKRKAAMAAAESAGMLRAEIARKLGISRQRVTTTLDK